MRKPAHSPREQLAGDAGERAARRAEAEKDQIENEDSATEEGESEKMDDLGDANAGHRTAYGGVEPGILDPLH